MLIPTLHLQGFCSYGPMQCLVQCLSLQEIYKCFAPSYFSLSPTSAHLEESILHLNVYLFHSRVVSNAVELECQFLWFFPGQKYTPLEKNESCI